MTLKYALSPLSMKLELIWADSSCAVASEARSQGDGGPHSSAQRAYSAFISVLTPVKESKIGLAVGKLRSSSNKDIADLAKDIVRKVRRHAALPLQ